MHATGPAKATVPLPERIGRYEILLPIASGGMATVYLARSRGIGGFEREVALKLTHPHLRETQEFASHLLEEAKLAVQIRHPNVVPVLDVEDDPMGLFLVMDYVHGDTLGGLRKKAALPPRIGMRILLDALAGLHAAHELRDEHGEPLHIVHRDYSPQNILVGTDGVARLTDFGIAKAATRLSNTSTGLVKGKAAYMAPEQARSLSLDRRCDVWAAGIIAWEILAQRRMYEQDDLSTLLKVVSEPPPKLRAIDPSIPPEVEAAVAGALAMNPQERTPTAAAFARALVMACGPRDLVAETEEVAAFVEKTAGPKLAERRRRSKEILELRARMGKLVDSADGTGPTPSGRELPRSPSSADATALDPTMVQERPPVDPLRDATAMTSTPSNPATPPSPSRPPLPAAHAQPSEHTTSIPLTDEDLIPEGGTRTDTNAISTHAVEDFPAPPRQTAPKVLVVGIAAAVALAGLILIVTGLSTASRDRAASSQQPPSPPATAVAADPPAATAADPTLAPAATATTANPPTVTELPTLVVRGNATIKELRIDNRAVDIQPGRELKIDLFPDEGARAARIVATSTDGRQAFATLSPGSKTILLDFPKAAGASQPVAAPPPKPAAAPTTKPAAPLAGNPYVKP